MIRHSVVPTYLFACLLLGGASAAGFIANLILQISALPLIGWALWQMLQKRPSTAIRAPLGLLALLIAVALVQLVPLPPALWTMLPGRSPVIEGYRLLGLAIPWLPLTLAPAAAIASLLWLLPAFATLLAIIVLGAFRARGIAMAIIAVTIASVALGALQIIGSNSAYLYQITNYGAAVGFFANANHNATLLLVCVPFLAALQTTLLNRNPSPRSASAIRLIIAAAYMVVLVGLLINASLAGIGLCVPVVLATWLTFGLHGTAVRRGVTIAAAVMSVATLVIITVGPFGNNLFGEQREHVELTRQTSFALTWRAAYDYFPFGSGIGSFQSIYHTQESLSSVGTTYMNHAHNDWLELLLETGVVGIALAILFLAWWGIRFRAILRADERDPFALAASIATATILLHSLVDYPLRTAALSAVFAACVGLMSGVRPYVHRGQTRSMARHFKI